MRTAHPLFLLTLVGIGICCASADAPAQVYRVQNFTTTLPNGSSATTGDRNFVSTAFSGASNTFSSANVGQFHDGQLIYPDVGTTYRWNDTIPSDFSPSSDLYRLNPDRGDTATPFPNEASGGAKLSDVFNGTSNLSYLLDGENQSPFRLELYYAADRRMGLRTDASNKNTAELLLLERGANSQLGVRAIFGDGSRSDAVVVDFTPPTTGATGLTGYQLDTLEINGAQDVGGVGIDVSKMTKGGTRISTGSVVVGFELFVDDTSVPNANGPDIFGFVGSTVAVPVPEPATLGLVAATGLAVITRLRRRAGRHPSGGAC